MSCGISYMVARPSTPFLAVPKPSLAQIASAAPSRRRREVAEMVRAKGDFFAMIMLDKIAVLPAFIVPPNGEFPVLIKGDDQIFDGQVDIAEAIFDILRMEGSIARCVFNFGADNQPVICCSSAETDFCAAELTDCEVAGPSGRVFDFFRLFAFFAAAKGYAGATKDRV